MSKKFVGECRLCGEVRRLSYEHVPPKAAFNNYPRFRISFLEHVQAGGQPVRGQKDQRGLGDHTLCDRCNNDTGAWYGSDYVRWAVDAMEYLGACAGEPRLLHARNCRPLRIIKQVLTMFCSVEPRTARLVGRRFLLDRHATGLPPSIRLFMYYTTRGARRLVPLLFRGGAQDAGMISELAHPPFGFVLKVDAGSAPVPEMFEITWFAKCSFSERRTVFLRMPLLETASPFPGDYRTSEQLERDVAEGLALAQRRRRQ